MSKLNQVPHNNIDIINFLMSLSSAIAGAAISAIHDYFYTKKSAVVSLARFVVGLLCSIYLTKPFSDLTKLNEGAAGFLMGLFGGYVIDIVLRIDWHRITSAYIIKKLDISEQIEKERENDVNED